jgi:ribonuclease-3
MTPERETALHRLEERLGHRFADLGLLDRALTHSSRANEDLASEIRHNEALEFLGDAVLGFLVADLLHRRDPEADEGHKTKVRALLVSAESLARQAAELGLPDLILLGRGEEKTGGRRKKALWADAFEAMIAALYLDGGIEAARCFLEARLGSIAPHELATRDFKSALQEMLQARGEAPPEYVVVDEHGPGHRRRYRIQCVINGRPLSEGEGYSKKEAQQEAARRAIESLEPGPLARPAER